MSDITQYQNEIKVIDTEINALKMTAESITVTNDIEAENANESLIRAKKWVKTVTEKKKMILKPIKDSIDQITAMFEPGLKLMTEIENILRGKILKYQQEQRKKQIEEEQRKKAEADAILAKQQESAQTIDEEIAIIERREKIEQKEIVAKPTAIRSNAGMAILKTRWTYTIENADAVPREYCEPAAGKLRDAVNNGVRSIPGVRIEQVDSLATR